MTTIRDYSRKTVWQLTRAEFIDLYCTRCRDRFFCNYSEFNITSCQLLVESIRQIIKNSQ